MFKIISISLLLLSTFCYSQIPVENYRKEISNLKSLEEVGVYWDQLENVDQNVLLKENNTIKYDSVSTSLMIRTVLMFELQNEKTFQLYKFVPLLNMAHSRNATSAKLFWPIIEKYKTVISKISEFYPSYPLESIGLNYYGYSLFKQDAIYDRLISKLKNNVSNEKLIEQLLSSHKEFEKINSLKQVKKLFKWQHQPFKDVKEDGFFEFVKMSDGKLYLKKSYGVLQKLILTKKKNKFKYYHIEGEPFGWVYKLGKDGSLCLMENDTILIEYTKLD